MRAALYARVATRDEQTLPMQLAEMRDYATRRSWTVVLEVEDIASGARVCPRREELIKAAQRRQIDLIVVWRLDRWGRSLLDLITTLQDLLSLGVGFVSLSDTLDMMTPDGRRWLVCWQYSPSSSAISCASGSRPALLTRDYGASFMDAPPTAMTRAPEMQAVFAQGVSKLEIARRLNVSRTSVRRLVGPSDNEDTLSPCLLSGRRTT